MSIGALWIWIIANISTIVVALILAAIIGLVVVRMVKRRKNGQGGCSCGCSGCAMSDVCHAKKDK